MAAGRPDAPASQFSSCCKTAARPKQRPKGSPVKRKGAENRGFANDSWDVHSQNENGCKVIKTLHPLAFYRDPGASVSVRDPLGSSGTRRLYAGCNLFVCNQGLWDAYQRNL